MKSYEEDEDLPWDPLWEYVLGEEDEKPKGLWWRRKKVEPDPGIMDFLFPPSETRDEHGIQKKQERSIEEREGSSGSGLVRRNSQTDSELQPRVQREEREPTEKGGKFWKRGKKSKNLSKESNGWTGEWELDPAITSAFVSHGESEKTVKPQGIRVSKSTKRKGNNTLKTKMKHKGHGNNSFRRSKSNDSESTKKDLKYGNNSFRRSKSNDSESTKKDLKYRDPQRNDASKSTRRVRFAPLPRSSKDEGSKWVDTDKIAAELQNSQRSFLEWVGITGSSDEEDEIPVRRRHATIGVLKDSSSSSSQNRSVSSKDTISESPFLFGSLLNDWGDLSSSEESGDDEESYVSTEDSGTITSTGEYTDAETTIASDDSQTTATNQSEIPQPVEQPVMQHEDGDRNYNEVRLTFQPLPKPKFDSANVLPALVDDGSADMENHLLFDEHDQNFGQHIFANNDRAIAEILSHPRDDEQSDHSQPITEERRDSDPFFASVNKMSMREQLRGYDAAIHSLEELDQSREPKGFCCSIKNLTRSQTKWSAKSGLPFQEHSQRELTIFPKIRSIRCDQKNIVSESTSNNSEVNFAAHMQRSLNNNNPQSILEYEYEKGLHMYVAYKDYGFDARNLIQVETAPTPPPKILKRNSSLNNVMLQVEASTVSMTDCLIRQGLWWGSTSSPLPNIPGADVVGKLHRIDEDSSKKFNLLKGDRVLSLVKWGGNSRYLPVDPSKLVKLPEMIDPAAATTLAETYLGAFQTLHHGQGNGLRYRETSLKGRNILVLGNACSNMGRAIVQLASAASADQVYALAKPKHFPHVLELGMTPLNKGSLEWWDLLNGRIDILISLGEDVQSLHCKALKSSGRAFVLSNNKKLHDSRKQKLGRPKDIISFRKKSKKVEFYDVYEEWDMNIERCKSDLRHLVSLLEHRKITPHILDRIPLHKVARAHVLMESKHLSGFIVCEPWLVAKTRAIRL